MTAPDYVLSAITFGIGDSWNPYMLAVALCFLAFLASVGDTLAHIRLAGRFLILVVFLGTFTLSWGANVGWLTTGNADVMIRFLSLGVAMVLLALGYLLLRQWRHGKKETGRQWLPLFLREDLEQGVVGTKPPQKNVGIIFFSVILGLAALALFSQWPPDRDIYPIFYALLVSGNAFLATLFFTMYSLAFAFWLIVIYRLTLELRRSAHLRRGVMKRISWINISCAAFFIAAGMGLIYLFTST